MCGNLYKISLKEISKTNNQFVSDGNFFLKKSLYIFFKNKN